MDAFWQDLRYATRSLRKSPLFAATVFLSLTVGFGAAVTMFAIVNAFFVRPLPFPDADQLVGIDERHPVRGRMAVAPANLTDMSARLTTIERLGAFQFADVNLGGPSTPVRILALECATDVFATLRVRAALGRTFQASDFEAGHDAVVVIANGLWREQFGQDPQIVGRTIRLDGVPRTVIGVMGPDFRFMGRTQAWVPSVLTPAQWTIRQFHSFTVVARLRPGVSLTQARAELDTLAGQLSTAYPATNKDWTFSIAPLRDVIVGPALWSGTAALLGAALLVLLMACANVANLMLVRGTSRRRELATRLALGSARGRLIRQLATEAILLAGASTTAGCLVAIYALRLIRRIPFSTDYPFDPMLSLDWRVIAFAAALAVLAAVAVGIGPALPVTKAATFDSLRTRSAGSGAARARASLVVLQVGLSVVLLAVAVLFVRTVRNLEQREIGLADLDHVVTMEASVSRVIYKTPDAVARYYDAVLSRVTQLPGVRHATLASYPPLTDPGLNIRFAIEGQDTTTAGDALTAPMAVVSPHFFATVGIPRIDGRTFEASDKASTAKVLVVNRSFVRRFISSGEVVGRRVKPLVQNRQDWYTVVGVVDDVAGAKADEPPPPTAYVLYAHMPLPWATLIVRTEGPPLALVPSIRRAAAEVDPEQPLSAVRSMRDLWAERVVQPTLRSRLVALFGVVAVTLALIGLYGLVAYSVTLRARDFAVRLALGAEPRQLVRHVVRQTLAIAAVGLGLGLIGAIVSGRLMSHLLFGVSPVDPLTLASVVISLGLAAALAAYVPARRVRSVDPLTVLRSE